MLFYTPTLISQDKASDNPAPAAGPVITATVGISGG